MNEKKIKAWMKKNLCEVCDSETGVYNCTLLTEFAALEFGIEDSEQLDDLSSIAFDVVDEETMDEQEALLECDDWSAEDLADMIAGDESDGVYYGILNEMEGGEGW